MQALITPSEADRRIAESLLPAETIRCPLRKASGRILREAIRADRPLPPFDRVMMDGIAIRLADLDLDFGEGKRTLCIVGTQLAGAPSSVLPDEPMVAMEAMTGAVCPQGADCIVPVERLTTVGDSVRIDADFTPPPHGFIHRTGSDYPEGVVLVEAGTRIGPNEIAIAASCGVTEPLTTQLPRIAIASTGDELVPVEAAPLPHQIRSSNQPALRAALDLARYPALTTTHLSDDAQMLPGEIARLTKDHDIVIFTGGISKGKTDFLPGVLDSLGAACLFHGVAQTPGKPMGAWQLGTTLILALPGNPVSSLTCLHRYVLPMLDLRTGLVPRPRRQVTITEDIHFPAPLSFFCPVALTDQFSAIPRRAKNSGDYASLSATSGFIELPPDRAHVAAGESFPFTAWTGEPVS